MATSKPKPGQEGGRKRAEPPGPDFLPPEGDLEPSEEELHATAALVATVMRAPPGQRLAAARTLGASRRTYEERRVLLAMSREMAVRLVGLSEDDARALVDTEPGLALKVHAPSPRSARLFGPAVIHATVVDGVIWSVQR